MQRHDEMEGNLEKILSNAYFSAYDDKDANGATKILQISKL